MSFPSHPPLPINLPGTSDDGEGDVARFVLDPKGWTYWPVWEPGGDLGDLQLLFPNVSIWDCEDAETLTRSSCSYFTASPVQISAAALYLTHTTTLCDTDSLPSGESSAGPTPSASPSSQGPIETAAEGPSPTKPTFDNPSVSDKSVGVPIPPQTNTMTERMSVYEATTPLPEVESSGTYETRTEPINNIEPPEIQILNVGGKEVTIDNKGTAMFDGQTITPESDGRFVIQSKTVTPVKDGKVAGEYLVDGIALTASHYTSANKFVSPTSCDSFGVEVTSAPNDTRVGSAAPFVSSSNRAHRIEWTELAVSLTLILTWTVMGPIEHCIRI